MAPWEDRGGGGRQFVWHKLPGSSFRAGCGAECPQDWPSVPVTDLPERACPRPCSPTRARVLDPWPQEATRQRRRGGGGRGEWSLKQDPEEGQQGRGLGKALSVPTPVSLSPLRPGLLSTARGP